MKRVITATLLVDTNDGLGVLPDSRDFRIMARDGGLTVLAVDVSVIDIEDDE